MYTIYFYVNDNGDAAVYVKGSEIVEQLAEKYGEEFLDIEESFFDGIDTNLYYGFEQLLAVMDPNYSYEDSFATVFKTERTAKGYIDIKKLEDLAVTA